MSKYLTFPEALEQMVQGKRAARIGWNGKGLFVFMQIPSTINKDIVPKMQSLPQAVKDEFQKRFMAPGSELDSISYSNQFAIVNQSNQINGWVPSSSDLLAADWMSLD